MIFRQLTTCSGKQLGTVLPVETRLGVESGASELVHEAAEPRQ